MSDPAQERRALELFEALLEIPPVERAAWLAEQTAGEPTLRARLERIASADRAADMRTGGAAADASIDVSPPERLGAYRLGAMVGRGGMGAVYVASRERGDFAHVVAIKIIKPGLLSSALVERFRRERQTLAGLSHPNIAQLFDGGETKDGAPYLVMEYVSGTPILEWIAAHGPGREARLALIEQIGRAVAFAHRNLIVHRDITPGNVLVTPDGLVKLIDFGIARPIELAAAADAAAAEGGSLAGLSLTPGYAAPERLTGTEVTTAADVYSFGKVIEKVLAPFADAEADAIVRRATEADPGRRYPTIDALLDDCTAWKTGHPVQAVGGGGGYRARKFLRRHVAGAAAAATALLLLVGALSFATWSYVRAESSRRQADARFEQTRAIAKTLLGEVYDEVSRVPGSTTARAVLARTGLTYLDALARDPRAPVDVRAEAGRGYVRLSQVVGGGQHSQLGRFEDANALLAEGERILAPLYALHPDRLDVVRAYAMLLLERSGANLYNNNKPALAREQAQRAQRLMAPTARTSTDDARRYAVALQAEGDSWGWSDDYGRARIFYGQAERFQEALPAALRSDKGVMSARSANLRLLAEAHHALKDDVAAASAAERAVGINDALVRAAPNDPGMLRKLAISLWGRAIALRGLKRTADAQASIARAMAIVGELRARAPDDAGALNLYAVIGEVDAEVLADAGRFGESFARVKDVIAVHRRMVRISGGSPGAVRTLASALATGATDHERGGDRAGACDLAREAVAALEGQRRAGALTPLDEKGALTDAREVVARACRRIGR